MTNKITIGKNMKSRKVEIVPYNPAWPNYYNAEAKRIKDALGARLETINHIGSTSIPDMPAKPVIDMLLSCQNLDDIESIGKELSKLGYEPLRRSILPHCSFFTFRQDEIIRIHLHLFEIGNPQIKRHIRFRDYLTQHAEDANAYADLKKTLAQQFTYDIYQYVIGKDKLVQKIDAKAKRWAAKKASPIEKYAVASREWSQDKIIKAIEVNLNIGLTHFAQYLDQVELIRVPGYVIVNTDLPQSKLNYVLDANFASDETNRFVSEVTNYFRDKKVPFIWLISPTDKPEDLVKYLEKADYQLTKEKIAAYLDLKTWTGSNDKHLQGLEIKRALSKKDLLDFVYLVSNNDAGFKEYYTWLSEIITADDPLEYYVGYVDKQPIACQVSCFSSGVAGSYVLTVAAEEENHYSTAMHQVHLNRAQELGYSIATVVVSPERFSFYQLLGYKECQHVRKFKILEREAHEQNK